MLPSDIVQSSFANKKNLLCNSELNSSKFLHIHIVQMGAFLSFQVPILLKTRTLWHLTFLQELSKNK